MTELLAETAAALVLFGLLCGLLGWRLRGSSNYLAGLLDGSVPPARAPTHTEPLGLEWHFPPAPAFTDADYAAIEGP